MIRTKILSDSEMGKSRFIDIWRDKPIETRRSTIHRLKIKYPDRVAILVDRSRNCNIQLSRNKFMTPSSYSFAQFLCMLRKKFKVQPEIGLFWFVNGSLVSAHMICGQIFEEYKSPDDTVVFEYMMEPTFGSRP